MIKLWGCKCGISGGLLQALLLTSVKETFKIEYNIISLYSLYQGRNIWSQFYLRKAWFLQ
jgi:hypothetical protein